MSRAEDELRELFGILAERQPVGGTDGMWLRARMRRHRMRLAGAALAVSAAVAGAAVLTLPTDAQPSRLALPGPSASTGTSASTAPSPTPGQSPASRHARPVPPVLDTTTGSRLLVVQGTRLEVLDVDTGQTQLLETDPRLVDYERLDVLAVAGELVLLGNNSTGAGNVPTAVLATTGGVGSPLREIGQASRVIASATPGRLWLSLADDAEDPSVTFTEVEPDGTVHRRVVLPGTFYAEPSGIGFLRSNEVGNGLELLDAQGRVQRSFAGKRMLHVGPKAAVLVDGPVCEVTCEMLVLRPTPAASEQSVDVAQVVGEPVADGAVTVDGRTLWTARGWERDGDVGSLHRTDLRTGQSTEVEGVTAQTSWGFDPQFTPDGRWMFWPDADGVHLNAYDLVGDAAYRVLGEFSEITSVVVLP